MPDNSKKHLVTLLVLATLISLLFNYFFLFNDWGVSILLFNGVLLVSSYYVLKKRPSFNRKKFFVLSLIVIVLSVPYVRFDFELFKVFNSLIFLFIYGLLAIEIIPFDFSALVKSMFAGVFSPFAKLLAYLQDTTSHALKNSSKLKKILLGLLFSCIVLIVVIPLLLSSDQVFETTLTHFFKFIDFSSVNKFILRGVVFIFVASYLYGHFKFTITPIQNKLEKTVLYRFDPTIADVFLLCINVVYVLYAFIQIKYLFLGNVLPNNMSYADYARQGFFQLVFVTAINIVILLMFNQFKLHRLMTNGLLLITVICTYIMTASAFYKMNLYESTYGYTRLRLLVYLFLITEIIVLVPMIIGILKPGFKFLEIAFVAVFICYLGITFINIDAFVAKQNVERYQSLAPEMRPDFDIRYLDLLSEDALLQLEPLINHSEEATAQFFKETILIQYLKEDPSASWFEYNFARSNAVKLYEKYYPNGYDANQIPYHDPYSQNY